MRTLSRAYRVWMTLIAVCGMAAPALAAPTTQELTERLQNSTAVLKELLTAPDRGVPEALQKDCQCIAVIPHVVKGAFVYGARHGNGVMSCRDGSGWTSPAFVTLTGGSWGLQAGAESSDLVVFFMNERGARSLITGSQITLGGKASVAAGPIGRSGEASTDLKLNAEIYTYAKSKGLFAGMSIEGARLGADDKANNLLYGSGVTAKQVLFERQVLTAPNPAREFRQSLP